MNFVWLRRSLILFPFVLCGCQTFIDVGDNIASHFSSPKGASFQIKNPVRDSVKLSVLWVGHATMLIQIYDKVIMTDPLFTNNVSEVLRRYVKPGLDMKNLNKLDLILISHSHSDHLSLGSLSMMEKKFPGCDLVFPDGVEEFIPDFNFSFHRMKKPEEEKKIYIGETKTFNGIKITTVGAMHWGGKYGLDGKLWSNNGYCGYIIQYKDVTVLYTGDTSYDKDLYNYLGNKYKIDLVIVNIIYCDCPDVNKNRQHVYPMGAVKILDETKARYMIPAHFGTFTDPDPLIKVLKRRYYTNEHYKEAIKILSIGEQFVIKQ